MSGLQIEVSVENVERVSSALASVQALVMPTVIKTARRAFKNRILSMTPSCETNR